MPQKKIKFESLSAPKIQLWFTFEVSEEECPSLRTHLLKKFNKYGITLENIILDADPAARIEFKNRKNVVDVCVDLAHAINLDEMKPNKNQHRIQEHIKEVFKGTVFVLREDDEEEYKRGEENRPTKKDEQLPEPPENERSYFEAHPYRFSAWFLLAGLGTLILARKMSKDLNIRNGRKWKVLGMVALAPLSVVLGPFLAGSAICRYYWITGQRGKTVAAFFIGVLGGLALSALAIGVSLVIAKVALGGVAAYATTKAVISGYQAMNALAISAIPTSLSTAAEAGISTGIAVTLSNTVAAIVESIVGYFSSRSSKIIPSQDNEPKGNNHHNSGDNDNNDDDDDNISTQSEPPPTVVPPSATANHNNALHQKRQERQVHDGDNPKSHCNIVNRLAKNPNLTTHPKQTTLCDNPTVVTTPPQTTPDTSDELPDCPTPHQQGGYSKSIPIVGIPLTDESLPRLPIALT